MDKIEKKDVVPGTPQWIAPILLMVYELIDLVNELKARVAELELKNNWSGDDYIKVFKKDIRSNPKMKLDVKPGKSLPVCDCSCHVDPNMVSVGCRACPRCSHNHNDLLFEQAEPKPGLMCPDCGEAMIANINHWPKPCGKPSQEAEPKPTCICGIRPSYLKNKVSCDIHDKPSKEELGEFLHMLGDPRMADCICAEYDGKGKSVCGIDCPVHNPSQQEEECTCRRNGAHESICYNCLNKPDQTECKHFPSAMKGVVKKPGKPQEYVCAKCDQVYVPATPPQSYDKSDDTTSTPMSTKQWQPADKQGYWYIEPTGDVNQNVFRKDGGWSKAAYRFGNCFQSKEEAEAMRDKLKELLND